jgi:hypothetical protein
VYDYYVTRTFRNTPSGHVITNNKEKYGLEGCGRRKPRYYFGKKLFIILSIVVGVQSYTLPLRPDSFHQYFCFSYSYYFFDFLPGKRVLYPSTYTF